VGGGVADYRGTKNEKGDGKNLACGWGWYIVGRPVQNQGHKTKNVQKKNASGHGLTPACHIIVRHISFFSRFFIAKILANFVDFTWSSCCLSMYCTLLPFSLPFLHLSGNTGSLHPLLILASITRPLRISSVRARLHRDLFVLLRPRHDIIFQLRSLTD